MWLREARLAKKWSQAQAVDELRRRGHHMAETTYRLFESGNRRPGPESMTALEDLFGTAPAVEETVVPGELVQAIYAQTEAINRLVERLDLMQAAREGIDEGIERALRRLGEGPPPAKPRSPSPAPRARGTRRGSSAGSRRGG